MYSSDKSAGQYFEDISTLAHIIVEKMYAEVAYNGYLNEHKKINRIIVSELLNIKNQIVFETYYILYLLCEKQHSLYYYCKESVVQSGASDSYEWTGINDSEKYKKEKYYYEKSRMYQDNLARLYYEIQNIGLYEKIEKDKISSGHKLRLLDYLFLERCYVDPDIKYMMKVLRENRLPNSNSISNNNFHDFFVQGIEALYKNIERTDYAKWDGLNNQYFLRSIDYYQLEKNCAIEFCYNSAYAVSNISKKLEDKKMDINLFRRLRLVKMYGEKTIVPNKAIMSSKRIFGEYLAEHISAEEVCELYKIINNFIYTGVRTLLCNYFEEIFPTTVTRGYWLDIYQNPTIIREECKIGEMKDFMCENTEIFFKHYFGDGQHIVDKNWNELKIKNFRNMYITD